MGLGRNSSHENPGKTRREPRLFPAQADIREDTDPFGDSGVGPATRDETAATQPAETSLDLPGLTARVRFFVILAWLLAPGFSFLVLRLGGLYSASDIMLALQRFGFAYIAACTLAAALLLPRHVRRIAESVAEAPDRSGADWASVRKRLGRFSQMLCLAFAAYCALGSLLAGLVLGQVRGVPLSAKEHALFLLATLPGGIMAAMPILFRMTDLIGAYFAERGGVFVFVSVRAKVMAVGLLTPIMISAALIVCFRDRTGLLSMEAVTVCGALLLAAAIGAHIVWSSLRNGLAPLWAAPDYVGAAGATNFEPDEHADRLIPGSLDEIGLLVSGWARSSRRNRQYRDELRSKEDHIRLIANSFPAPISYIDTEERIRFVNGRYRDWWQVERDSLIGKRLSEFLPPEVYAKDTPRIAAALAGVATTDIAEYTYPDGKWRICEVRYVPHKSDRGDVLGCFALISEVTEQRDAQKAAEAAHQRLLDAIESMPAGFRIFDADERLVLWNSKYLEQTRWHGGQIEAGITFEEILRRTVAMRGWIDQVDHDDDYIANRLAAFRDPGAPFEMSRSDGRHFLHIFRKTADGGTVAIMLEITAQKEAELRAERERRRLLDSVYSLPVGFRLYDKDDRLVYSNDDKTHQFAWRSEFLKPGATYEEILRESVAHGLHVHDMESDEAYIEFRLRQFRHSDGRPVERRRSDGRTGLMYFRKTLDGETACIVIDVTEERVAEQRALENHQRLQDAIESLPAGFCLFDSDERLALFNSVQKDMMGARGGLLKPGTRYEEILRESVSKGMYRHDFPGDEDYIAFRLKQFRAEQSRPSEIHYATGRHVLKFYRRTSNGGIVTIQMDVTERVVAEKRANEASQRLFDAIESLPVGFCLFNNDEQLVMNNSRQRDMTSWHKDALHIGATFEELVRNSIAARAYQDVDYDDPDDVEAFVAKRLEHFRDSHGDTVELSRSSGASTLSAFHRTTDGGTVSLTLDITERKRGEQALKTSEGRLNAILDLAPEAIITTDGDHCIQMFNASAERLFGYAASEAAGRNLEVLFAQKERNELDNGRGADAEPPPLPWQTAGRREMIALHRNGREFPVEISVAETAIGGARLHTVLLHDISERKKWEDDLRRAMQLADAANRAKSEFLSHMSHELRTPLNGILGYAEFIRDKWLGDDALEQYVEYAGFITESGRHLLQLINDILDLSKVEAGQYEAVFAEVDIAEIFKECELIVASEAMKAGVEIDFKIQPGSARWTADRRALKQIVINLLSNAIKFSAAGSTVDVESSRDETGHYRLTVADTGVGMSEAEAKRALQPFVQVSQPYVSQRNGTGLGLALVVRLAALHCGSVEIDSEPQRGTTVHVAIPPLPQDAGTGEAPNRLYA